MLDGAGQDRGAARSAARRDQNMPLTARLSASVPPEVKTTSLGRAPSACGDRLAGLLDDPAGGATGRCSDDALPDHAQLLGHGGNSGRHHRSGGRVVEVYGARHVDGVHHLPA